MLKNLFGIIIRAGEIGVSRCRVLWEMSCLFYDTVTALVYSRGKNRISSKQIIDQVLFTGVDAFPIISIIGLLCGVIITVQAVTNMPKLGAGEYFGTIMVIAVIRELGPFFTSFVVIGRSGAALAAYIGNMRVSKEISALESMGIDTTRFLVLPGFTGMIISVAALNFYFDVIAIVGGLVVSGLILKGHFLISISSISNALTITDIFVSIVKSILFGAVIAVISCYNGLNAVNIRMVPRAVFKAVVGSMIATLAINVIMTLWFYA